MTDERPAADAIAWEYRVPLLDSRFMWWDMVRVDLLSVAIMWLAVAVMGWFVEGEFVALPWQVPLLVAGIMLVVFVIACLLLGNRFPTMFRVDAEGVSYESGKRGKGWNRAAVIFGILGGSPGTAGAGLLATAQEAGGWTWAELHRVIEHPRERVITLRNSWRTVLRVYCTPENWEQVRSAIAAGLTRGAEERALAAADEAGAPVAPRRSPFALAGWVLAPVLAGFCVPAWAGLVYEDGVRAIVLGVLLVIVAGLVEGPVRRAAAALALVPVGYVAWIVAREAFKTTTLDWLDPATMQQAVMRGWEYDSGLLAVTVAGLVALGSLALVRLFGKRRGY